VLLCEAAVLAPELPSMHLVLIFQMSLLDIYVQVGSSDREVYRVLQHTV
jgi:hypothetical protein